MPEKLAENAQKTEAQTQIERHYLVAEYDENDKLTRFCAKCGRYMADEVHFRVGETLLREAGIGKGENGKA